MHHLFIQPGQKLFWSIISHNGPSLCPSLCGLTSPLASPQQHSLILATSVVEGQRQGHVPKGTCKLTSYIKVYLRCSQQQPASVHLNSLSVAMCPAHAPLGNQHSWGQNVQEHTQGKKHQAPVQNSALIISYFSQIWNWGCKCWAPTPQP